ncbi:hypothetical protein J8281_11900 [Aquimarina sp. U1-2]|uniref:sugar phosphate isomerase/epimerase family protein n=1 Tax=Aquimarina sp. U1-2 TaxID=2823141 RepID=UPI001AECB056|nr:hypothetical protein [Aquimarina sp. U1-2]MBP2832889.1 hypothetical protein [Aquimarina sp. U1-2]
MNIKFYYPIWSIGKLPLNDALYKIKENGYDGAEIALEHPKDFKNIVSMFNYYDLELLAQHPFAKGKNFSDFRKDYNCRLEEILKINPTLVNCHTGKDYFSFKENIQLINDAEILADKYNITITQEIHRGRFSYAPMVIKNYIENFPNIKLTADFSHWCVVTESLLENHKEAMTLAIKHAAHIHARVGYDEGPQVNDPFAPEHKEALESHLFWWQQICDYRKQHKHEELVITCEFGPKPYLQNLPYTQQPVTDIWNINLKMKSYLKQNLK